MMYLEFIIILFTILLLCIKYFNMAWIYIFRTGVDYIFQ